MKKTIKTSALFTLFSFLVTSLSPVSFAAPSIQNSAAVSESGGVSGFHLDIPSELGTIENLKTGTGPVLIHIQTAHGNYEAQKKIQGILEFLNKNYGIKTLLLEGNPYKFRTEYLHFYPDMDINRDIADRLTKEALLKGPELFLLDHPEAEAYGIEKLETYKANGEAFKDVLRQQEKTGNFLGAMDMQIDRLTSPYLNKDLRSFLKRLEDFEAKRVPFMGWLNYLRDQAEKNLDIKLTDAGYQVEWPMLVRLFVLGEFEKTMDAAALSSEKTEFLKAIKGVPADVYSKIESLLNSQVSRNQLPDPETRVLFEKMAEALPQDFAYNKFPNVKLLVGHLILQSEIKSDILMAEEARLVEKTADKMAPSEQEKQILSILKDYRLLKKLFALELTPEDYEQILSRGEDILPSAVAQRFLALNGSKRVKDIKFEHLADIDALFQKAVEFYRLVKQRDLEMTQLAEQKMKELHTDKAVVVTGGFHTQPFENYFASKGFSYALISPKITSFEGDGGKQAYVNVMLENDKPLSTQTREPEFRFEVSPQESAALGVNDVYSARHLLTAVDGAFSAQDPSFDLAKLNNELNGANAPKWVADHMGGVRVTAAADNSKSITATYEKPGVTETYAAVNRITVSNRLAPTTNLLATNASAANPTAFEINEGDLTGKLAAAVAGRSELRALNAPYVQRESIPAEFRTSIETAEQDLKKVMGADFAVHFSGLSFSAGDTYARKAMDILTGLAGALKPGGETKYSGILFFYEYDDEQFYYDVQLPNLTWMQVGIGTAIGTTNDGLIAVSLGHSSADVLRGGLEDVVAGRRSEVRELKIEVSSRDGKAVLNLQPEPAAQGKENVINEALTPYLQGKLDGGFKFEFTGKAPIRKDLGSIWVLFEKTDNPDYLKVTVFETSSNVLLASGTLRGPQDLLRELKIEVSGRQGRKAEMNVLLEPGTKNRRTEIETLTAPYLQRELDTQFSDFNAPVLDKDFGSIVLNLKKTNRANIFEATVFDASGRKIAIGSLKISEAGAAQASQEFPEKEKLLEGLLKPDPEKVEQAIAALSPQTSMTSDVRKHLVEQWFGGKEVRLAAKGNKVSQAAGTYYAQQTEGEESLAKGNESLTVFNADGTPEGNLQAGDIVLAISDQKVSVGRVVRGLISGPKQQWLLINNSLIADAEAVGVLGAQPVISTALTFSSNYGLYRLATAQEVTDAQKKLGLPAQIVADFNDPGAADQINQLAETEFKKLPRGWTSGPYGKLVIYYNDSRERDTEDIAEAKVKDLPGILLGIAQRDGQNKDRHRYLITVSRSGNREVTLRMRRLQTEAPSVAAAYDPNIVRNAFSGKQIAFKPSFAANVAEKAAAVVALNTFIETYSNKRSDLGRFWSDFDKLLRTLFETHKIAPAKSILVSAAGITLNQSQSLRLPVDNIPDLIKAVKQLKALLEAPRSEMRLNAVKAVEVMTKAAEELDGWTLRLPEGTGYFNISTNLRDLLTKGPDAVAEWIVRNAEVQRYTTLDGLSDSEWTAVIAELAIASQYESGLEAGGTVITPAVEARVFEFSKIKTNFLRQRTKDLLAAYVQDGKTADQLNSERVEKGGELEPAPFKWLEDEEISKEDVKAGLENGKHSTFLFAAGEASRLWDSLIRYGAVSEDEARDPEVAKRFRMWNIDLWDVVRRLRPRISAMQTRLAESRAVMEPLRERGEIYKATIKEIEQIQESENPDQTRLATLKAKAAEYEADGKVFIEKEGEVSEIQKILEALSAIGDVPPEAQPVNLGVSKLYSLVEGIRRDAAEYGYDAAKVLKNYKLSISVNLEIIDDVKADLIANDFFGLDPQNITLVVNDSWPGYEKKDGQWRIHSAIGDEKEPNYNHGYNLINANSPWMSFVYDKTEGTFKLQEKPAYDYLKERGAETFAIARINDSVALDPVQAFDAKWYGMLLAAHKKYGANGVHEVMKSLTAQKGGLANKPSSVSAPFSQVTEGLNIKTAKSTGIFNRLRLRVQTEQRQPEIPYNRLYMAFFIGSLQTILAANNGIFPMSVKDNVKDRLGKTVKGPDKKNLVVWSPEIPSGDLTTVDGAKSVAVVRRNDVLIEQGLVPKDKNYTPGEGTMVHDFKEAKNLLEVLLLIKRLHGFMRSSGFEVKRESDAAFEERIAGLLGGTTVDIAEVAQLFKEETSDSRRRSITVKIAALLRSTAQSQRSTGRSIVEAIIGSNLTTMMGVENRAAVVLDLYRNQKDSILRNLMELFFDSARLEPTDKGQPGYKTIGKNLNYAAKWIQEQIAAKRSEMRVLEDLFPNGEIQLTNLDELASKAEAAIKSLGGTPGQIKLDHVNFAMASPEASAALVAELKAKYNAVVIGEPTNQNGRLIYRAYLPQPITVGTIAGQPVAIDSIEISDPKPGVAQETFLEHAAFIYGGAEFSEMLDKVKPSFADGKKGPYKGTGEAGDWVVSKPPYAIQTPSGVKQGFKPEFPGTLQLEVRQDSLITLEEKQARSELRQMRAADQRQRELTNREAVEQETRTPRVDEMRRAEAVKPEQTPLQVDLGLKEQDKAVGPGAGGVSGQETTPLRNGEPGRNRRLALSPVPNQAQAENQQGETAQTVPFTIGPAAKIPGTPSTGNGQLPELYLAPIAQTAVTAITGNTAYPSSLREILGTPNSGTTGNQPSLLISNTGTSAQVEGIFNGKNLSLANNSSIPRQPVSKRLNVKNITEGAIAVTPVDLAKISANQEVGVRLASTLARSELRVLSREQAASRIARAIAGETKAIEQLAFVSSEDFPKAANVLIGIAQSQFPVNRRAAVTALVRLAEGEKDRPILINALQQAVSENANGSLIEAVRRINAEVALQRELLPSLVQAARNGISDESTRIGALAAFEEAIQTPGNLNSSRLRQEDLPESGQTIQSLISIAANSNVTAIRVTAIRILRRLRTAEALPVFVEIINNEDRNRANARAEVTAAASAALLSFGEQAVAVITKDLDITTTKLLASFGTKASPAVPVLVETILSSPDKVAGDTRQQFAAAESLRQIAAALPANTLPDALKGSAERINGLIQTPTPAPVSLADTYNPERILRTERIRLALQIPAEERGPLSQTLETIAANEPVIFAEANTVNVRSELRSYAAQEIQAARLEPSEIGLTGNRPSTTPTAVTGRLPFGNIPTVLTTGQKIVTEEFTARIIPFLQVFVRIYALSGLQALVNFVSGIIGREVHQEAVVSVEEQKSLDSIVGPVMLDITPKFFTDASALGAQSVATAEAVGRVAVDYSILERLAKKNPHALAELLRGIKELQPSGVKILATVLPKNMSQPQFEAMLQAAIRNGKSGITNDLDRRELIDAIPGMIEYIPIKAADATPASALNNYVKDNQGGVAYVGPSFLAEVADAVQLVISDDVEAADSRQAIALVVAVLLMQPAAKLVAGIQDKKVRASVLSKYVAQNLPGIEAFGNGFKFSRKSIAALLRSIFTTKRYVETRA